MNTPAHDPGAIRRPRPDATHGRRAAARALPPTLLVVLTLAASACEIPTEAPIIDQRWAVPVEDTRFGVGDLLPGQVSITPDSSAFLIDFDPIAFATSLGAICPACALADGLTVPKPAFTDSFGSSIDFPAEVSGAEIIDGTITVQVTNGLNFDPLNPSAAGPSGSLYVVVRDAADGDSVAAATVAGDTISFAPGVTLDVVMPLRAVTLDGGLEAEVVIDSPVGDPVTVNASLSISVNASADQVRVAEVAIDVSGQSVTLDPVAFDLDELGEEVQERVQSGALLLDVVNPFQVAADFQLTIAGPTMAPIQKSLSIVGTPLEKARVDFTTLEIEAILGESSVTLTGGAIVDPAAGVVVVQPGEELFIDTTLDVVIRLGG